MTPRHVTVSVGVPSSYFEDVWRYRNPSAPGTPAKKPDAAALTQIKDEVISDIEKHVMQVLPASEEPSKEVTKLVRVTSFPTLPVAEIEKPSTADHAMVWFNDHASSVGLGLLGFFSSPTARSIARSVPPPVASSGEPELKVAATPVDEAADSDVSNCEIPQPRIAAAASSR